MQILLAFIVGAAIGAAAHFALPDRSTRGPALAPILGALIGGVVWLILTWAGLGIDSPWLWLASFAAPVLTFPAISLLTRLRLAHDERERVRLKIV